MRDGRRRDGTKRAGAHCGRGSYDQSFFEDLLDVCADVCSFQDMFVVFMVFLLLLAPLITIALMSLIL